MFNPFMRLVKTDGVKVDVNANQVTAFWPNSDGSTTVVGLGLSVSVKESAQAVRGAMKRAFNPKSDGASATDTTTDITAES